MADVPSAAAALYPTLPSAAAGASEQPAPAPDRSAAATIYGAPEGGLERARTVSSGGVAAAGEPGKETAPRGRDTSKAAPAEGVRPASAPGPGLDVAALGLDADAAITGEFSGLARELGITQAAAEKLLPLHERAMAQAAESHWERQTAEWEQETRAQFPGRQLDSVVANVMPLLNSDLITPGFRELLGRFGLGSQIDVIQTLHNIANALRRRY